MSRKTRTTDQEVAERTGETIRALLEHHGITQTALARFLLISNQSMGNLARGKSLPSFITALKLGDVFGISTRLLLDKDRAIKRTIETLYIRAIKDAEHAGGISSRSFLLDDRIRNFETRKEQDK